MRGRTGTVGGYPLTSAQRGVYLAHLREPGNPCAWTAELVELDGHVDAERLARALDVVLAENPQLTVAVVDGPEGPRQHPAAAPRLRVVEVADDAAAQRWTETDLARAADLPAGDVVRPVLLRTPHRDLWYQATHHVVADGFGAHAVLRRTVEVLAGASPAEPLTLEEISRADRGDDPAAEARWDARVAAWRGEATLDGRTAAPAPRPHRTDLVVPEATSRALASLARELGAAWPDALVALVGAYVARFAGRNRTRVGVPLMNRTAPGVGTLATARGACTATNVLPVVVPGTGTLREVVTATVTDLAEVRRDPFVRPEDLARRLRRRDPAAQLAGPQVNVVPFDAAIAPDGVTGRVRNLAAGPVDDVVVTFRGTPRRGLSLEVAANPRLHDAGVTRLHAERVLAWLVAAVAAGPDADLGVLELLPAAERRLVVEDFNATSRPREAATLGARFRAAVAAHPDETAIVADDATWTYAELLAAATVRADELAAHGVRPGDAVGIALGRSAAAYAAVHAVALLDAVYVPLDPEQPEARTAAAAHDARVRVVLGPDGIELLVHTDDEVPGPPGVPDDLDALAYVIFTSGSTGRPKGVAVSHRAIDNRLAWMQHHLPLAVGDRVLHKTPVSFDVSVWELYWPLQVGATVVVAPPGAHRDPRALADLVVAERVGTLHFVPSMLRALLADRVARRRVGAGRVRHLVTSGEALTSDLVRASVDAFGVAPVNLYGPTEAAVDVTCWDTRVDEDEVPIGRPVWNTTCDVLDAAGRPVPVGVVGELWLGGVQLALGYVGRPDLTAERFRPDGLRPGGRVYRTGDLASWRSDGALRYHGRADDQVKIRGQRLELGEVEAVLGAVEGVDGVAAALVDERLVVWLRPSGTVPAADLRAGLAHAARGALPAGVEPHRWVEVAEIPVSTSGKTDRRALVEALGPDTSGAPTTDDAQGSPAEVHDGPADLAEQRAVEAFGRVLGRGGVGRTTDFFDAGGDSLGALALLVELERVSGARLALADVLDRTTPAAVAPLLVADAAGAVRSGRETAGGTRPGQGPSDGAVYPGTEELLVLRRGEGDPLILLPPAGGLGWCYTGLLRGLPEDLPVLALQRRGVGSATPDAYADLGALVARFDEVLAAADVGRVHLAGWSLGGLAAHALATRVRARGGDVGAVVVLDAYPTEVWSAVPVPDDGGLVDLLRMGGVEPPAGEVIGRARAVELLRAGGSAVGRLPGAVLDGALACVLEARAFMREAEHPVLAGDLDVVVASAPRAETWLDVDAWRPYVRGEVRAHPVPATHGTLVGPGFAAEVGRLVGEATVRADEVRTPGR